MEMMHTHTINAQQLRSTGHLLTFFSFDTSSGGGNDREIML